MRYLIASDIHGSNYYTQKLLEIMKKEEIDKIILLGDLYYHGPRNPFPYDYCPKKVYEALNNISDKLIVIKGNCDSSVDQMVSNFVFNDVWEQKICGKNFLFTHGDIFNIDNFPNEEFDILVYGHFHNFFIKQKDEKIIINPGSISLPKENSENSYLIIDENKKELLIKNFSNKILLKTLIQ